MSDNPQMTELYGNPFCGECQCHHIIGQHVLPKKHDIEEALEHLRTKPALKSGSAYDQNVKRMVKYDDD